MKSEEQIKKEIERFKYDINEPEVDFPIHYLDPQKTEKERQKILKIIKNSKQPKIK